MRNRGGGKCSRRGRREGRVMQEQVPLGGWSQVKRGTRGVCARARVNSVPKVNGREGALLEFLQRLCSLIVRMCLCSIHTLLCVLQLQMIS